LLKIERNSHYEKHQNHTYQRLGTLDFKDGMPSKETVAKIYDNLDFTHAFEAFVRKAE
jgi:hypothetical protein